MGLEPYSLWPRSVYRGRSSLGNDFADKNYTHRGPWAKLVMDVVYRPGRLDGQPGNRVRAIKRNMLIGLTQLPVGATIGRPRGTISALHKSPANPYYLSYSPNTSFQFCIHLPRAANGRPYIAYLPLFC